jgi:hypothetical protein
MCFRFRQSIVAGLALTGVLLASCASVVENHVNQGETYETLTTIAYAGTPVSLALVSNIPGMMRLIGYSGSDFITGTFTVSNQDWMPKTEQNGGKASLVQTVRSKVTDSNSLTNLWKLRVSDSQPFILEIDNARAEGHWNLSGLPITGLQADLGTAKNAFTFDEPNPTVMQTCSLRCSNGEVIVEGILNAVCQNMTIVAGKGSLTLRFNGKVLLQSLRVNITAADGDINITISPDIPILITLAGKCSVVPGEGILRSEDTGNSYETESYEDNGKTIEIAISGGSGTIYLNPPA